MTAAHLDSGWTAGVARRRITPGPEVELAGLGYYLKRTPERVRDDLAATALVIGDSQGHCVALVALDLMYADEHFTRAIRQQVAAETAIPAQAVCVNCSHSHNAPTAAFVHGVGEVNAEHVRFVSNQAVQAITQAWRERQPARLRVGRTEVPGLTFNRTRQDGPTDNRLSVLRADTSDGRPLAVAFNFHSHLTAHLETDLRAVSRDWVGEVIDQVEAALPGATALCLQGTCGDVMLRPEFNSTERRFEPARALAKAALEASEAARPLAGGLQTATRKLTLPTRPWDREEVIRARDEALHRLKTGDTTNWLEGFARVIVTYPHRLPLRYGGSEAKAVAAVSRFAAEWAEAVLPTLDTKPEFLETEVQALRLGDAWLVAHSSELFSTLGLEVRQRWPHPDLFMLGYSNGSLGYLPDAHDVERRSYAADQSPKFSGQFPFTAQAGTVMVEGLLEVLRHASQPGP